MWDCPFAGGVWGRARQWIEKIDPGLIVTWARVERGVGSGRGKFLIWLIMSLIKRGLWLARQDLVGKNRDGGVEGVIRRVEMNVKGRIERDTERWGKHAALERWKGGLGWSW